MNETTPSGGIRGSVGGQGESFDAARDEILRMGGSQFDPVAVEAFAAEEAVLRRMVEAKCLDGAGLAGLGR